MNKKELYYDFNKEVVSEYIKLFYTFGNNGDFNKKNVEEWKKGFEIIKDKYLNEELALCDFLQIINLVYKLLFYHFYDPNFYDNYSYLLPALIDIKKYKENKKEKIDVNIYELLVYICRSRYDDPIITVKLLCESLENYPDNKYILSMSLDSFINEEKAVNIIESSNYDDIDKIGLVYHIIFYYYRKDKDKYNSKIKEYCNFLIETIKPYKYYHFYLSKYCNEEEIRWHIYHWKYENYLLTTANLEEYERLYSSLFCNDEEEQIKKYEKIIKGSTLDEEEFTNAILSLSSLYLRKNRYDDAYMLLIKYYDNKEINISYNFSYRILFGKSIYKSKGENDISGRDACHWYNSAIERINYCRDKKYAIKTMINTIWEVNEMEKKGHAPLGYSKLLLKNLYYSHWYDICFQYFGYKLSYEIGDYNTCINIISDFKNSDIYKKILLRKEDKFELNFTKYMINSIHNLNTDNINELNKIFEEEDFSVYKNILIDLINKRAETELLNYDIEILNKEVLIELYRIMSILRKDIIIRELFDFVESAEDCLNEVNKWKNTKLEKVNYFEKEYTLCYHYRSYQINKKMPDNYIAVSQIRNTLTHRINENKGIENFIKHKKDALNFIDLHFQSIVKCLFDIIINHNILSLEHFRSDEFLGK
ncbi:hypothetical protein [Brachyspira hampsonii]|uniref:Uncharacterized protein n=2 Tax=Brachyspira hampsonii TaxID=1287055 RepID=A0A2U4EXM5_9SPIR|nr:hypothetical protein [Brachyspira hampsonii]EKV58025.1 hypothetical protein A966_01858 [Brachyspira hampsonii 30446]MBW5389872.1 hypothetical protein [Brachyspira hampsonii]